MPAGLALGGNTNSNSNNNAEASSSKLRILTGSGKKRGRSESRTRNGGSDAGKSPSPSLPSADGAGLRMQSPTGQQQASTARRVRTVPPSARFEPPSPPSPLHTALPDTPAGSGALPSAGTQRTSRRKHKIRYSSSESSSGEESDSDDEPPWWTFTQRGMMRLRARGQLGGGKEDGAVTEGESGRESGKERSKDKDKEKEKEKAKDRRSGVFASSSRRSSRDKEGIATSSSKRKLDSTSTPSKPTPTLLQPAPIRLPSSQSYFRRSHSRPDPGVVGALGLDTSTSTPSIVFVPPVRPSSAPTSPIVDAPSPGMTTLVDGGSRFPSAESQPASIHDLTASPHRSAKRQLTAPAFPRFFKRDFADSEPVESLTDTEAVPSARNKLVKSKSAQGITPGILSDDVDTTPDGANTPSRPRHRPKPSHRLRINLPPPITQHFSHGWPHAGSWQDALYASYSEAGIPMRPSRSRRNTKLNEETNGELEPVTPTTRNRPESVVEEPNQESAETEGEAGKQADKQTEESQQKEGTKRSKSKRTKRYRQALVPPTPSGLGFTPRTRTTQPDEYPWTEGHDPETGFDWQNGNTNANANAAQKEAKQFRPDHLDNDRERDQSVRRRDMVQSLTATDFVSAKGKGSGQRQAKEGGGWGWMGQWRARSKARPRTGDSDWRRRYRRILFLDARVTIWIRLVNLAVVIALLALSVTIRLHLDRLRLPGLIGSSTTLMISYSAFTMPHVLTAIYREYFGKPIGLWGLRSKMLWVCLDLLFVALWSSAMSLAINDLIATPLECTAGGAWWRSGLSSDYAALLAHLAEAAEQVSSATGTGQNSSASINTNVTAAAISQVAVTSVSAISETLGITLPQSVLDDPLTHQVCRRQAGCIALSLLALMLYGGNMVLSLFRIFETVRRTANVGRAVTV